MEVAEMEVEMDGGGGMEVEGQRCSWDLTVLFPP